MAILDAFKKEKGEAPKDETPKDVKAAAKKAETAQPVAHTGSYDGILTRPHVTEKAALLAEGNVYTFVVPETTNKIEIKKAVKAIYNVEPKAVRIVNIPAKKVFSKGRHGVKSGKKKALVYLKSGDTIEFV